MAAQGCRGALRDSSISHVGDHHPRRGSVQSVGWSSATSRTELRRSHCQEMRWADAQAAKRLKGTRWCLLKDPEHLEEDQPATLRRFRRHGRGGLARLQPELSVSGSLRRRP